MQNIKQKLEELKEKKRKEVSKMLRLPYSKRCELENIAISLMHGSNMNEEEKKYVLQAYRDPSYINTHNPEKYKFVF